MAFKQLVSFNQAAAGRVVGYCLQNVRKGYGVASKYPTAIEAWNHTQQHKDRSIPSGVSVPLFYTYKSDGHVNVRLTSGRVWSDGTVYDNLDAYLNAKPAVKYLGWGESVNDVRVLQYVEDPKPSFDLPAVGSKIQLLPTDQRTTFVSGTATVKGKINVTDQTFKYVVRGHDPKFKNRILINSVSGGGDGVSLALYYLNGNIIPGWKRV